MLDVEMAKLELSRKSMDEIHKETAWKWASRSAAAFEISKTLKGVRKTLKFSEALEYRGEALEHASQHSNELVKEIQLSVTNYYVEAMVSLSENEVTNA